jgi:hypothetical protein
VAFFDTTQVLIVALYIFVQFLIIAFYVIL